MIDARPAAIVRCATDEDVVAVVRTAAEKRDGPRRPRRRAQRARASGPPTVRSSPTSRGMQSVHVDDAARTASAGGGTTWGRLQRRHRGARPGHHRRDHLHHRGRRADPRRRHRLPLPGVRAVLRQPGLRARGDRRRLARHRERGREPRPVLGAPRRRRQLRRRHRVHLPGAPGRPRSTAARCSSSCPTVPPSSSTSGTSSTTAPREYGGFPAFQIAPPLPFVPEDRVGRAVRRARLLLDRLGRGGRADPRAASARCRHRSPSTSARCRTRR